MILIRNLWLLVFFIAPIFLFGQEYLNSENVYLKNKIEPWQTSVNSFVENKGQFDGRNWKSAEAIEFAYANNPFHIFFTKKGYTYRFDKVIKNPKRKKNKKALPKRINLSELIDVEWVGANESVEIVAKHELPMNFTYAFSDSKTLEGGAISGIKGFYSIVYKNIYNNIDIEYLIHPEGGVKYNIILHEGADPNVIKMRYATKSTSVLDEKISLDLDNNGQLLIKTSLGEVLEKAPKTFYKTNGELIESSYRFENNELSFELGDYDASQKVIIDPWIITPNYQTSTAAWEVETDAAGNVYSIGGEDPMELKKYDINGNLQWSYVTPWDTNSVWLGTLATDAAGNSYVTSGVQANMHKVDDAGNFVWATAPAANLAFSSEWWSITFNCDESQLIVGGTWVDGLFSFDYYAGIYDIDVATGNVLGDEQVDQTDISQFGATPVEIRSISSSKNAKYVFLTHEEVGAINQNIAQCSNNDPIFQEPNQNVLAYKCENYLPATQNGGGLKAIIANEDYFYTHTGDQIHQWDLTNGNLIGSAAIPGGSSNTNILGGIVVHNSGLDVDECGNVYAGSMNQVVKYDQNLNQLQTIATTFNVYDVDVNSNGEVIACGAQQNNQATNRNGRIESVNLSACAQFELICCDANFCQEGPFCEGDAPVTLDPATTGGTWSGPGVDPNTGVFDPSAAGTGTHTITYTLACGSESLEFVVNPCATLTVCEEANGDLTVTGGTGPYEWQEEGTTSTPITNSTECTDCGYTWTGFSCVDGSFNTVTSCASTGWVTYDNGVTTNPPGSFPIQINDNDGNSVIINSASDIPPCSSTPCTNLTVTIDTQSDVSCNGANDGSATVSATGGNGNYTYTWTPGNLNGATQNNLGPGSYTVDVVDSDGCDGQVTVEITEPPAITLTTSTTDATCGQNDGSASVNASGGAGGFSYNWTPGGGTSATFNNIASGSYTVTVTDANGCEETTTVTVNSSNGPTLDLISSEDVSCFGEEDGSGEVEASGGTPGYTYTWTPGGLNGATQNSLPAGTYTVSVEDDDGCVTSIQVEINEPDEIVLNTSSDPSSCTVDDGSISVTASGGTGPYTYEWTPGGETTATVNNVGAGSYSVTVTDDEGCTASANVNVSSINGPTVVIEDVINPSCAGEENGAATANVSGGTAPYGYQWSPAGGNGATGTGLGAGTYTVTVTDDAGCTTIEEVTLTDPQPIILSGNSSPADCGDSNGSIIVSASGGSGGFTYTWDPNVSTSANASGLAAGSYNVTATDANGCTTSETFIVGQSDSIPTFIVPSSATIPQGGSVILNVETDPTSTITTYNWSPSDGLSCTDCPNPTASPSETTTYTVIITNEDGCIGEAQITIVVDEPCGETFLPTMFSPNKDGVNDEFCVLGNCVIGVELVIYNRWGEKVFETNDPAQCWRGNHRGKPVNTGVYAYKAKIFLNDGSEVEESGNITLVR